MPNISTTKKPKAAKTAAPRKKAASLPHFVCLPHTGQTMNIPPTTPNYWLGSFCDYVSQTVGEAEFQLKMINWLYPEMQVEAICAAKKAGLTQNHLPPFDEGFSDPETGETLKEFLWLSLEKARYENTLRQFRFWERVSFLEIPQDLLDDDRQDNFNVLFEGFLDADERNQRAQWEKCGLTKDQLWKAFQQNGDLEEEPQIKPKAKKATAQGFTDKQTSDTTATRDQRTLKKVTEIAEQVKDLKAILFSHNAQPEATATK